jgi:hypothetical protein
MSEAYMVLAYYAEDDKDEPVRVFLDYSDALSFAGLCNGVNRVMQMINMELYELMFIQLYGQLSAHSKKSGTADSDVPATILELQSVMEALRQGVHPAFPHYAADDFEVVTIEME